MTTYFVVATDAALLPPEQQSYSDLTALAADVEKDVINEYTRPGRSSVYGFRATWQDGVPELVNSTLGLYVYLRGYKVDSANAAVDADLKDALKRTIAEAISWRITRRIRGAALAGQSVQGVSRAYLASADALWPKGWDRRLRRFDLREVCWGS